jgi:hypothetical protein
VTVELLGESAHGIEPHVIRNAALAVLHYFKAELGRTTVSVAEFSRALEVALRGLGLSISTHPQTPPVVRVVETDLGHLVRDGRDGLEMAFFQSLREEMRRQLIKSPHVLRLRGLRGCVKSLTGSKRWNGRCRQLTDQIVEYARRCLKADSDAGERALLVLT